MDDKLKNILKLLLRSKPLEDGWYRVSNVVWPLIENATDDLIEKRKEVECGFCRLTERGKAVCDYL